MCQGECAALFARTSISIVQAHPDNHTSSYHAPLCSTSNYPTISGWCFHSAQSLVLIFLFKPAFWVAFFVNASTPNELTFRLLELIAAHGGQPIMRPGGITMDSMIYDPFAGGF